jgi:hypothetical protein
MELQYVRIFFPQRPDRKAKRPGGVICRAFCSLSSAALQFGPISGYRFGMSNQDFLERAFALAANGSVRNVKELLLMLGREGYSHAQLSQIRGTMGKQLLAKIVGATPNS